jgi:hypothetical protein
MVTLTGRRPRDRKVEAVEAEEEGAEAEEEEKGEEEEEVRRGVEEDGEEKEEGRGGERDWWGGLPRSNSRVLNTAREWQGV